MTNKSYPGLCPSNYPAAPMHGTITHVAVNRVSGCVTAIGLDNERLDISLGQQHAIPKGASPVIGQPLRGLDLKRNSHTNEVI